MFVEVRSVGLTLTTHAAPRISFQGTHGVERVMCDAAFR